MLCSKGKSIKAAYLPAFTVRIKHILFDLNANNFTLLSGVLILFKKQDGKL
jgi:hypothetical protein